MHDLQVLWMMVSYVRSIALFFSLMRSRRDFHPVFLPRYACLPADKECHNSRRKRGGKGLLNSHRIYSTPATSSTDERLLDRRLRRCCGVVRVRSRGKYTIVPVVVVGKVPASKVQTMKLFSSFPAPAKQPQNKRRKTEQKNLEPSSVERSQQLKASLD